MVASSAYRVRAETYDDVVPKILNGALRFDGKNVALFGGDIDASYHGTTATAIVKAKRKPNEIYAMGKCTHVREDMGSISLGFDLDGSPRNVNVVLLSDEDHYQLLKSLQDALSDTLTSIEITNTTGGRTEEEVVTMDSLDEKDENEGGDEEDQEASMEEKKNEASEGRVEEADEEDAPSEASMEIHQEASDTEEPISTGSRLFGSLSGPRDLSVIDMSMVVGEGHQLRFVPFNQDDINRTCDMMRLEPHEMPLSLSFVPPTVEFAFLSNASFPEQLELGNALPDGNCGFRSLSQTIFGKSVNQYHTHLRLLACDFIEKNPDYPFVEFWMKDIGMTLFKYLRNMRQTTTWMSMMEMFALACALDVNIFVWQRTITGGWIAYTPETAKQRPGEDFDPIKPRPTCLLHLDNRHFDPLFVKF
ncbi:hypothetical protein L596_024300 [Steinernema carpocapsae]|uniref:OTU domain-containing protein n=1 Tax=Steinernema carpocapsae TaxID=34508 RepID=A0A4U5MH25_STECR|nr:hypothetical protein L596_024300 [Steinernema carpocapsae]